MVCLRARWPTETVRGPLPDDRYCTVCGQAILPTVDLGPALWTEFGEKLEDIVVHQGNGLARMGENKWLPFL